MNMIRTIELTDARGLSQYLTANKTHFEPWEPIRESTFYSEKCCSEHIYNILNTTSSTLFVFVSDRKILGHCELSQIVYGPFQACYMGYGVSKEFEGKGVGYELCSYAIEYAFSRLKLHRIMANYMPSNHRSGRLLKRLGFRKEGLALEYLKIAGAWEDHILTSLINPNCV
ncbi:GNAT family N-acetyltransferase [Paraglaciecola aquimarina]|uniref:GNAT family N-acetyltransferase n=1 Tax=Paraglaciecola aquimarina TaxID=1235557 RepID=A0ABU3SRT0_9ALTE|nr:GNAT family N-acetyltransferase [Paraglaciecola aquimarina]MDU0352723.1 GNAT family N-acetyltransferase [Paraglaciecola aquimarina]